MLRACNKLLRPGARIAYTTIVIAPGLSKRAYRAASKAGPRSVTAIAPVAELMDRAGFAEIDVVDVTEAFVATAHAWFREFERFEHEVKQELGAAEWQERQRDRSEMVQGAEAGLLQRLLVTARSGVR